MTYAIADIIPIVRGQLLHPKVFPHTIEHLLLDSRQVIFPDTTLFFAIKGKRHDGHHFIDDVYQKGVRNFVISNSLKPEDFPEANFILVSNSLWALQKLATYHRQQFQMPVIGITGSNGKTIVKEWLFQLMREDYAIARSPKSYNSQVGVPLSVWQMAAEHQLAILEAGISEKGEMARLAPIVDCNIGLFTNIGPAHAEGFDSMEEKLEEKLQLFANAKTLICCIDNAKVAEAIRRLRCSIFSWTRSKDAAADLQIRQIKQSRKNRTQITGIFKGEKIKIVIPFIDMASIENAIHCWAVLLYLKKKPEVITQRMLYLEPVAMRLELKAGINGCTLINDSYNSDLASLDIALQFLDQQSQQTKKSLILSDILQSGQLGDHLYSQVAKLIQEHGIYKLIGIGKAAPTLEQFLPETIQTHFYPDTDVFLQQLQPADFQQEAILLKGARQFAFEKIARLLEQQVHRTTLEVNLNALVHNLNVFHKKLSPHTKLMVMVKAAAYGSGSLEVARLLEFHQVDYLAVAYADEGAELRQGGIRLPILVLNPEEAVFEILVRHRLEPEIYSPALLRKFAAFTTKLTSSFPIHIKVETGMNRLGFEASQLDFLIKTLRDNPQLKVQSVFSHLAASEDKQHDSFTHAQVEQFYGLYQKIADGVGYRPIRHILNSSGISRFSQYQMDMVRLGIGIYGIDNSKQLQSKLQTVLRLKASISQIKQLERGQSIGYGRVGKAQQAMRIGTVSIGYADGLSRRAGQGRYQLIVRHQPAPIIGNVCMDMCMIDLSHIPDCQEGDEVLIFGEKPKVETLAQVMGTIPYEVLTGISSRVKRVYVQE